MPPQQIAQLIGSNKQLFAQLLLSLKGSEDDSQFQQMLWITINLQTLSPTIFDHTIVDLLIKNEPLMASTKTQQRYHLYLGIMAVVTFQTNQHRALVREKLLPIFTKKGGQQSDLMRVFHYLIDGEEDAELLTEYATSDNPWERLIAYEGFTHIPTPPKALIRAAIQDIGNYDLSDGYPHDIAIQAALHWNDFLDEDYANILNALYKLSCEASPYSKDEHKMIARLGHRATPILLALQQYHHTMYGHASENHGVPPEEGADEIFDALTKNDQLNNNFRFKNYEDDSVLFMQQLGTTQLNEQIPYDDNNERSLLALINAIEASVKKSPE